MLESLNLSLELIQPLAVDKSGSTLRGVDQAKFLPCAKPEKIRLPPPAKSEKLGHWIWHESLG